MSYFEMMENVVKKYGLESKVSISFCSLVEREEKRSKETGRHRVERAYKRAMK